jgi:hypothetical protein
MRLNIFYKIGIFVTGRGIVPQRGNLFIELIIVSFNY